MIRELAIHTTEPVTLPDGGWACATFTYHERLFIPYDDWVDIRSRPPAAEYLVGAFRHWMWTVPEMTFRVSPVVERDRDLSSDKVIFVFRSSGYFTDNDDPQMREVLRLIDHPVYIVDPEYTLPARDMGRVREVYRQRSMLQSGTVDNNPNPDFTTDSLIYRVNQMRDALPMNWTDWRRIYGTHGS